MDKYVAELLNDKQTVGRLCNSIVKFIDVCNGVRKKEGADLFPRGVVEVRQTAADGTLENALAPSPALIGFVKQITEEVFEKTKYGQVFNPTTVGSAGDIDIKVPFVAKQGRAQRQTMNQYFNAKGSTPKTNTTLNTDTYDVVRHSASFDVLREEILQVSAFAGRYGIGGLSLLDLKSRNALDIVTRDIDEYVFSTFTSQFGNGAKQAYKTLINPSNATNWTANDGDQGKALFSDMVNLANALTATNIFSPKALIMSPAARAVLVKNILGDVGHYTVAEKFKEVLNKVYKDAASEITTIITTRVSNVYLVDNSPTNMITGFTENLLFDEPDRKGSNYEQTVLAKGIGFNPLIKDAAVGLKTGV